MCLQHKTLHFWLFYAYIEYNFDDIIRVQKVQLKLISNTHISFLLIYIRMFRRVCMTDVRWTLYSNIFFCCVAMTTLNLGVLVRHIDWSRVHERLSYTSNIHLHSHLTPVVTEHRYIHETCNQPCHAFLNTSDYVFSK